MNNWSCLNNNVFITCHSPIHITMLLEINGTYVYNLQTVTQNTARDKAHSQLLNNMCRDFSDNII